MPEIVVYDFIIDDDNAEKFQRHGLTSTRVLQVLEGPYRVRPNRRGRPAVYLFLGRDGSGQCIAIPIEATSDPAIWRPVTAWRCKASESAWLR